MTHICVCKYPLMIVDNRESQDIEYLAMPIDVIKDGNIPVPDISITEETGFDGLTRDYVVVKWQDADNANTKKYDVAGHIVIAGCEISETSGGECSDKNVYTVLHPMDEWVDNHVIELAPKK